MSTLKTNNIEHLDASTPAIQVAVGGGVNISGVTTVGDSIVINGASNTASITGVSTIGVTTVTTNTLTVNGNAFPSAGPLSNRNLIINGDMRVAQRGITSTTTADVAEYNTVDRWYWNRDSVEELVGIMSQFSDGPSGYSKCWRFTTDNTAETGIEAADRILFYQEVEAQNLQFLEYGQSTAKDITCSFYVKSSETGTYGFQIYQTDGNRIIGTTYTINAADTWEYKEITFPGDTGGTINDDNGEGLRFQFTLVSGSNYTGTDNTSWGAYSDGKLCYGHAQNDVVTSVGNYWSVTGCQMEVGERATPFEHRSYGQELALCQRYFQTYDVGSYGALGLVGRKTGTGTVEFDFIIPHPMRAAASGTWTGTLSGFYLERVSDGSNALPTAVSIVGYGIYPYNTIEFEASTTSFSTVDIIVQYATGAGNQQSFTLDAEL